MTFFEKVYEQCMKIPQGKVSTYGRLAALAGNPRMSRQVGWALHANPRPGVIPCHRVVNRFGQICSGFAFGGPEVQRMLLEREGVAVGGDGTVDLSVFLWDGRNHNKGDWNGDEEGTAAPCAGRRGAESDGVFAR
jgi:methylated-DNA-protein-cysteine methyltransferase-like protein